jgi:ribosomal protein S18 acetylase RimI-like enzyme
LTVFVAEQSSAMVGFATVAPIAASLRLGHWWQIRDLFVAPEQRRVGVARSLLEAIRAAAEASGALRLGLQTEADNAAALSLYRAAGYTSVTGYQGLTLPLDGSRRP